MAGLLFLAFAYLAVGQASANRSGAQTAADAAALAAAQNTRDQLVDKWTEAVLDPTKWQDIFDGNAQVASPCWRAAQLAGQNNAHLVSCVPLGPLSFKAEVKADKPVGDSVVPGTEAVYATATATAVIEPLCTFESPGEDAESGELPELTCKDHDWQLDPDDLTDLPGPEDLFDVHLAD